MEGRHHQEVVLPIWQELLVGVEMLYLRLSPVYWGCGIPKGDKSAVIVVPAFLGTDFYLTEFRAWLQRIGYRPYKSSIGINAECPNLLSVRLAQTIETAYKATHRKVHLVGHSLGGLIARTAAAQQPGRVASVISMGAPLRGISCHPTIERVVEIVRGRIRDRHGEAVLPACYTAACSCEFLKSCVRCVPDSVAQTAIYTKADGILDWHSCCTGNPAIDREVSATHIGMAFNPIVYELVANRLGAAQVAGREGKSGIRHRRAA